MKNMFAIEPTNAVDIVDGILEYAHRLGASDIHIDPRQEDIMVRLRLDGIMHEAGIVSKMLHEPIVARLKILSGTRTDLHLQPQDGRWRATIEGADYNMRISFMPTYFGENAVVRLLPVSTNHDFSLAKLGFNPDHVRTIDRALGKPHGLILVTGPTGSGKTTTLHAFLRQKSREPLSIITLEDPVEYEIPGVRQIHMNHTYGVTFATGLRAALRQDPDVIMVGEIRDAETAHVAIHTALTGHLVLSTLHTNTALQAITRLTDMGIDRYLLASTLKLVIAERLVRNVCPSCYALGCGDCHQSGYRGRSLITELLEVDFGLAELIGKGASLSICEDHARANGFCSIDEDGAEKVDWGVTTREEVARVLYE